MRLIIIVLIGLLISEAGYTQKGTYYLAQYDLTERGLDNNNFNIAQDNRGLVYMANLKGVLVSDGRDWSVIETPYSVFALAFDESNNLYVGGRKEIAVIDQFADSGETYKVISKVAHEVFKIVYVSGRVYFLSEDSIYIYNVTTQGLQKVQRPDDVFMDMQVYKDQLYVSCSESGLLVLSDTNLIQPSLKTPNEAIGFRVSQEGQLLGYTSAGEYFIKGPSHIDFVEFVIEDTEYLKQNTVSEVVWVNEDLLAVSTISGGVIFVNSKSGKVEQYMNYENGLADNEVLSLFASNNHIVWCATPQGVSIISPEIPFRNFATYNGLSGNIQVVYEFNNQLYVGTSVGLFKLVKKTDYEEVVTYKKVTKEVEKEVPTEDKKKKRGLFRRKDKKGKTRTTLVPRTYYSKQVQKEVLSIDYEYERVENIDAKVVQIINYYGKLLVGTLSGIYELRDNKAVRIFDQPMVYMYKPENRSFLMVSTYDKEVKVLRPSNDVWKETGLLEGLDDFVEQIVQGNGGSLWLCGADSVYRIELSNAQTLTDVEVYGINNPHWERIYSDSFQDKIYFLNSSGYYYYDEHSIKRDTLIEEEIGLPEKLLLSSEGKLWVNTGHFWYGQGQSLKNSLNFISLFEDPRYLSEVGKGNYWVVAGGNQLYKIDGQEFSSISRPLTLFLERAQMDSVRLPVTKQLGNFKQQSSLSFKFASPDFTNIYQTEFQYRLVGLSQEWSEWSRSNNEIVFPYLPSGKYLLEVRARDALGNIQNSESIGFSILAPYWKRPWFYLLEVIIFAGLMSLSVWINRHSYKFTLLSRLLTFLTLILVVEFVQTIAEAKFETNQSPVINFFIQVGIALSILPVESLLRKFITSQKAKRIEAEIEKKANKSS